MTSAAAKQARRTAARTMARAGLPGCLDHKLMGREPQVVVRGEVDQSLWPAVHIAQTPGAGQGV